MRDMKDRLFDATGLPRDAAGTAMRIHMEGNRQLSISGIQAVREYSLARIRVQVEGGQVVVHGDGLELSAIGEGIASVAGRIGQVDLLMEEG